MLAPGALELVALLSLNVKKLTGVGPYFRDLFPISGNNLFLLIVKKKQKTLFLV